jgi:hypothetical protein
MQRTAILRLSEGFSDFYKDMIPTWKRFVRYLRYDDSEYLVHAEMDREKRRSLGRPYVMGEASAFITMSMVGPAAVIAYDAISSALH